MTKEIFSTFWVVQKLGSPIQFVTYSVGLTEDVMLARKHSSPESAKEWAEFVEGEGYYCRVRKVSVTTKIELE